MGRKERRAKERQERKESIRMTPDRIYELKQKTANDGLRYGSHVYDRFL